MKKASRVISESTTDYAYVIREEYWPNPGFHAELLDGDPSDETNQFINAINNESPDEQLMTTCYTVDGYWIGNIEKAKYLCETLGICPVPHPDTKRGELVPCSIGLNEKEQKWYGWSHRAIFGFGIGDIVEEGGCCASSGWTDEYLAEHPEVDKRLPVGFKAETLEDAKRMAIAFANSVS